MASRTAFEAGQMRSPGDDRVSDDLHQDGTGLAARSQLASSTATLSPPQADGLTAAAISPATTPASEASSSNALWKPAEVSFTRRMRADVAMTMPDGDAVRFWKYEDPAAPADNAPLLSPPIRIREHAQAQITLETHRWVQSPHSSRLTRAGLSARPCAVWLETHESHTYHWQPQASGTWFYQSHVSTPRHFEMGLYGIIAVEPEPGEDGRRRASRHGPSYDVERFWVFDDVDPVWHDAGRDGAAMTGAVPPPAFRPKYFLVNGVPNTLALEHKDVAIEAKRGDQVLLRLMNAGFSLVKVQLQGLAANIIAVDGNTLGGVERPWTRWITVAPGQPVHLPTASRYDILLDLDSSVAPGDYQATFEFQDGRRRVVHNTGASHPAHIGRAATTIRVL